MGQKLEPSTFRVVVQAALVPSTDSEWMLLQGAAASLCMMCVENF